MGRSREAIIDHRSPRERKVLEIQSSAATRSIQHVSLSRPPFSTMLSSINSIITSFRSPTKSPQSSNSPKSSSLEKNNYITMTQAFEVPNTDYTATPETTGIDAEVFSTYFSPDFEKQIMCAAHPFCKGPKSTLGKNTPHRCIGCGLTIHCKLFCGEAWEDVSSSVSIPDLPGYGKIRVAAADFPIDSSVLCYRCLNLSTRNQKAAALSFPLDKDAPLTTSKTTKTSIIFEDFYESLIQTGGIDEELWFDWLQDNGHPFIASQSTAEGNKKKKNKMPSKPKHIYFESNFYHDLYRLSQLVIKVVHRACGVDNFLPRLPAATSKNVSKIYHYVGEWLAAERKSISRADIHNMGAGVMECVSDFVKKDEYKATNSFFVLDQTVLFKHLFHKFGPKETNLLSDYLPDDCIRVMGIIFNCDILRNTYLNDMIGRSKSSNNRNELDKARSGTRTGFFMLHQRFIDSEVRVVLPAGWGTPDCIELIDKINGPGTFAQYGNINPNNIDRIQLLWKVEDVSSLFKHVLNLYNKCMNKYTMGTGGGSGRPENFSNWEERESGWVSSYLNDQLCNLYLSAIHMWDKEYSFVLVKVVGNVPEESQIDDVNSGGSSEYTIHRPSSPWTLQRTSSKSSSSKKHDNLVSVLENMSGKRDVVVAATTELNEKVNALVTMVTEQSKQSSKTKTEAAMDIVNNINTTQTSIERFKDNLRKLRKRKKEEPTNESYIQSEITRTKRIINGFYKTLDMFTQELDGGSDGDFGDGSGSDDENNDISGTRKSSKRS